MDSRVRGLRTALVDAPLGAIDRLENRFKERMVGNGIAPEQPNRAKDRARAYLGVASVAADVFVANGVGITSRLLFSLFDRRTLRGLDRVPSTIPRLTHESANGRARNVVTVFAMGVGYALAYAYGYPSELGALAALPSAVLDLRDLADSFTRERS